MIGLEQRLAILLDDADLAALLVAGGYSTPRQIKAATNRHLLAVTGIGETKLAQIRVRFPKVG